MSGNLRKFVEIKEDETGSISTLADPSVVDRIIEVRISCVLEFMKRVVRIETLTMKEKHSVSRINLRERASPYLHEILCGHTHN